ncbi:MAG: hypothetical protein Q9M17_04495 [Mariprofundus sp.]|nr:hypothetical protein [Mariprofundus sp.]
MNTPAHAIINLLLMGKKHRGKHALAIIAGALIADAPMLVFYLWEKYQGLAERLIWSDLYHQPAWQMWFNAFHSFPLLALACFVAWRARLSAWSIFFASMFCHSLFDFPFHHNDAHQHLFPFSDYRFISPLSYWNPEYFGLWIGSLEILVMIVGSIYLLRSSQSVVLKRGVSIIFLVYLMFILAAAAWWFK